MHTLTIQVPEHKHIHLGFATYYETENIAQGPRDFLPNQPPWAPEHPSWRPKFGPKLLAATPQLATA